jgi:hypothetical protein
MVSRMKSLQKGKKAEEDLWKRMLEEEEEEEEEEEWRRRRRRGRIRKMESEFFCIQIQCDTD